MEPLDEGPQPDRLYAPLLLVTGSAVLAAGTLQTAGRWLETCAKRSSPIADLVRDSMSESDRKEVAKSELRDEVLGILREFGEIASQQARKSVEEFDSYTRDPQAEQQPENSRPQRVKP